MENNNNGANTNAQNNQPTPQPPAPKPMQENTLESVLSRIKSMEVAGDLKLPQNYSPENAVRSAWLIIQGTVDLSKRPALDVCTTSSIANALLSMVLSGLNPEKKQCYFIVYGNKLEMQKSYFGQIAISKRVAGVKEAIGVPIYEGDNFKYTIDVKTGTKTVTEHDQDFMNIDVSKLKGAYAVISYEDGRIDYEIMTMQQIRASWGQGKARGESPAHKNFPDQMACKTVVNRALKIPINSSNDDDLFSEEKDEIKTNQIVAEVNHQITQNANGENGEPAIGFEDDTPEASFNNTNEDGSIPANLSPIQEPEKIVNNTNNTEHIDKAQQAGF